VERLITHSSVGTSDCVAFKPLLPNSQVRTDVDPLNIVSVPPVVLFNNAREATAVLLRAVLSKNAGGPDTSVFVAHIQDQRTSVNTSVEAAGGNAVK